jgi:hypothetical protein
VFVSQNCFFFWLRDVCLGWTSWFQLVSKKTVCFGKKMKKACPVSEAQGLINIFSKSPSNPLGSLGMMDG